jgi:hypothetical protein
VLMSYAQKIQGDSAVTSPQYARDFVRNLRLIGKITPPHNLRNSRVIYGANRNVGSII